MHALPPYEGQFVLRRKEDDLFAVAGGGEDGEFALAQADKCEVKRRLVSAEVSTSLEQVAVRVHVVDLRRWAWVTVTSVNRLRHRLYIYTHRPRGLTENAGHIIISFENK